MGEEGEGEIVTKLFYTILSLQWNEGILRAELTKIIKRRSDMIGVFFMD